LVALAAALIVTLFSQFLKLIVTWRLNLNSFYKKAFFTLASGLLFSLTIIFVSQSAMGPGKDLLNNLLFKTQYALSFSDVIARFLGSSLTYANGGAGGIFAPVLSLGGTASSYCNYIFNFDLSTLSVLIGMTAGLAALTHSPLTSFILILEMTDRHRSIFPLMLAALIGHGVSKLISQKSFYEFVYEKLLNTLNRQSDTDR
jgi:H+/Cl- antiporter ClcA